MPLSVTQAQALLNSLLGSGTPATWYMALYFTEPTATGGGIEMSGDAYVRLAILNDNTKFTGATATSPSVVNNAAAFTFATPGTNWGTIGFWGLLKTATGGSPVWFGSFSSPLVITAGNPVVIAIGNLNLGLG